MKMHNQVLFPSISLFYCHILLLILYWFSFHIIICILDLCCILLRLMSSKILYHPYQLLLRLPYRNCIFNVPNGLSTMDLLLYSFLYPFFHFNYIALCNLLPFSVNGSMCLFWCYAFIFLFTVFYKHYNYYIIFVFYLFPVFHLFQLYILL